MKKRFNRGFTLIELMIVIAVISVLMLVLIPNMVRSRNIAKLTSCKQGLRNLASSMESYATDHNGRYPENLDKLTEKGTNGQAYIEVLPVCPVIGTTQPYKSGFEVSREPDSYTIICKGSNHVDVGLQPDYPQYTGAAGLLDGK